MDRKLKPQSSKIKNIILEFASTFSGSEKTNIETLAYLRKLEGYKSVQLELVDSKLEKLSQKGVIQLNGTLMVNDPDGKNTMLKQSFYKITEDAYE